MAQPVRGDVGSAARSRQALVHRAPHGPRVDPATSRAEEQRGSRVAGVERRPATAGPLVQGHGRRTTEGHRALLVALAQHPDQPPVPIELVDIEPAQLDDPDAGCVEQLEHRHVADADRPSGLRPARAVASASIVAASACSKVGGRPRTVRGDCRLAAGFCAIRSFCSAQAKNIRTAAARRCSVARARPWICWLASQLRNARRSTASSRSTLSRPRWPKRPSRSVR